MRIIQISDLHGNDGLIEQIAGEISSTDLVILSGDITNFGGKRKAAAIVEAVTRLNPNLLAVPGNCDRSGVAEYLDEAGVSVDGVVHTVNSYTVCGMGGSLPAPGKTPTEFTEEEYADRFKKLASAYDSVDIAVIHQPPADSKLDRISSGGHVGSKAVRDFLEASEAFLCLTGHIHESIGTDTIGNAKAVNPGAARNGHYAVIEVEERTVTIDLKRAAG